MLFPILGPNSLPVVVAQPDEIHANSTASVLEWYDRPEHTTSCSNEEDSFQYACFMKKCDTNYTNVTQNVKCDKTQNVTTV